VIQDFPDRPIVQLPQSVHFASAAALTRSCAIFDAHPDLTLVLRDRRSLEIARQHFRAPAYLCPDMAFGLGALPRPVDPAEPLVWLARTDRESTRGAMPSTVSTVDWVNGPVTAPIRFERWLLTRVLHRPRAARLLQRPLAQTLALAARHRLRHGCRLLSAGQVVVTDRLHAHILSLLLGIPHVILDNSYGKLRQFYETWTDGSELVRWASDPAGALALASEWTR
jgi:pyruvyl transferase EpsO